MTNAELDAVKQTEDAKAWEELNKEYPRAKSAVAYLKLAVNGLASAFSCLTAAAELVDNTPEYDRIMSLSDDVEKLETEINKQKGRME